ncbi:hypothetical protein DICA3_E08196 [Diutina catenulata]
MEQPSTQTLVASPTASLGEPRSPLRPSRAGNLPQGTKSLRRKPSRLDWIDDTKLTSLPLAPPPPTSSAAPDADDEYEASDDSQIVLVEDYMTTTPAIPRKHSLAMFKRKLQSCDDFNRKRPAPQRSGGQHLESIFGTLAGTNDLKHCDLCDKPLYEISSLAKKHHQEFVCGECVETYEEFSHEFSAERPPRLPFTIEKSPSMNDVTRGRSEAVTPASHREETEPHRKLVEIFSTIEDKYTKRRKFSDGLVNRLNQLHSLPCRKQDKTMWVTWKDKWERKDVWDRK